MAKRKNTESCARHPLANVDEYERYKTMMAERADLIKARRESEDNLVKTLVQISSVLIVLIAGMLTQKGVFLAPDSGGYLIIAIFLLIMTLVFGLAEQVFSSKAHSAQQKIVEAYYSLKICTYAEPIENVGVRWSQRLAFSAFLASLAFFGIFSKIQVDNPPYDRTDTSASAASPAATSTSTSTAAASTTPASSANTRSR